MVDVGVDCKQGLVYVLEVIEDGDCVGAERNEHAHQGEGLIEYRCLLSQDALALRSELLGWEGLLRGQRGDIALDEV